MAHLLEHYLFQGRSAGVTDPLVREIEGMSGSINLMALRQEGSLEVGDREALDGLQCGSPEEGC